MRKVIIVVVIIAVVLFVVFLVMNRKIIKTAFSANKEGENLPLPPNTAPAVV